MIEKAQEIMQKFHLFTGGYRVCMLIDRGEANSNKGSRRWVNKLISGDSEQLEKNIAKLLEQQEYLANPDVRLYMCVNARSLPKAIRHFQHRMIDAAYEQGISLDPILDLFYTRIQDAFCSSMMKPESRMESLFLIDWDSDHSPDGFVGKGIKEIFRYRTPNGWHVITEPFNPLLMGTLHEQVKKDALLLLNTLGFES